MTMPKKSRFRIALIGPLLSLLCGVTWVWTLLGFTYSLSLPDPYSVTLGWGWITVFEGQILSPPYTGSIGLPSSFGVPLWLPSAVFGIGSAILLFLPGRRFAYPACNCCGYNLTGNTSGICPECGTQVSKGMQEKLTTNSPKL